MSTSSLEVIIEQLKSAADEDDHSYLEKVLLPMTQAFDLITLKTLSDTEFKSCMRLVARAKDRFFKNYPWDSETRVRSEALWQEIQDAMPADPRSR